MNENRTNEHDNVVVSVTGDLRSTAIEDARVVDSAVSVKTNKTMKEDQANANNKAVVLLVDDKPANIIALENVLAGEGRILLSASTGAEALKMALEQPIDLIILDVQMPGMDGFEVAQVLKSNRRTREIPIIFATAENRERRSVMKGYDEGAVDYLFKPLDPDVVRAKVAVLLQIQLQKKELREKNESLEKNALLINNSADILGVLDEATMIVEEMNPAFETISGFSPDKLIGSTLDSFLAEGEPPFRARAAEMQGDHLSFETNLRCRDGAIKCLQWNVTISRGKWFLNARDITDLKEANRELESFCYSVSHDLRAPLRSVAGFSAILAEDYESKIDAEGGRLMRNIRSGAERMSRLIDDLLAFSRLGRKEVHKGRVDMKALVEAVLLEQAAPSPSAQIVLKDLPPAIGDHALLRQVWINLVSNAIKYSSRETVPTITIGSVAGGELNTYFIRDNGAGFDMKYAGKLFGVFQRLHNPKDFEGTGVGLAIVQRIIAKHGGRIWAEAAVNEGACFYFTLPA